MYKIAVCDDCFEDGAALRAIVNDYFERQGLPYEITIFSEGNALLAAFISGARFDIYFLDIIMTKTDGMSVARALRDKDEAASIAFVTTSVDYAIEGYSVRALDYILKPFLPEQIEAFLSRAVAQLSRFGTIVIKVRNKSGYKELLMSQIVCAESRLHTLSFTMSDGSTECFYARLEDYAALLTRYNFFLRCHKSYIVNLNYVAEMGENCFLMNNDRIINISRSYRSDCRKKYHKFILDKVKGFENQ